MNLIVCLICVLLIPLAAAGLSLIHQGLGRSRSAAHSMLTTLAALAVASICFVLFGSAFSGFAGSPVHSLAIAGVQWDWLGSEAFFGQHLSQAGFHQSLEFCVEMLAVGLAAIIPLSTGADRWRLPAICASSAVFAAFIFPVFTHWVWGGGWLSQMARTFGIPPFADAGGAGVIQILGGLSALSVAWIVGPRRGKYSEDNMATAIPGHNIVLVLFGCMIALVGWIGLDSAASILFYGAAPAQVPMIVVNAVLSASAGLLTALLTTQLRYRKPDASISSNGWIAGLVAGSACCALVSPMSAIFVGSVAGILVAYLVEIFEIHLLIDDPGGAISVHAGAGLWGLIALGIFDRNPTGELFGCLLSQLIGIATLIGCMLPLVHGMHLLLNRLLPYRVDRDGDWQGMDIRELGSGAYPEFVIHADEFVPR